MDRTRYNGLIWWWGLLLLRQNAALCSAWAHHFHLINDSQIGISRGVWRYQRGNHNPYIENEQTTQWPKENVEKEKQRSTKHTYKTKYRVTWTPLKTREELRYTGRVSSSCFTIDSRRFNLVANPVISHETTRISYLLSKPLNICLYSWVAYCVLCGATTIWYLAWIRWIHDPSHSRRLC